MYAYRKFFFIAARPDKQQFILPWGQKYQLLEKLQMALQMNDNIAAVLFTLTTFFPTLVMSVVEMFHSGSPAQKLAALEVIFSLFKFVSLCIWMGLSISDSKYIELINACFGLRNQRYRNAYRTLIVVLVMAIILGALTVVEKIYALHLITGSDIYQCGIHYPGLQNNHTSNWTTPSVNSSVTI